MDNQELIKQVTAKAEAWLTDAYDETTRAEVRRMLDATTENASKFWITKGGIELAHNKSQIPQKDLKKIGRYIMENRADILAAWFDYFNQM